ncbi:hypothetical protein QL285_088741 [Trifolium repens]|nr:hypothetical protein QL285_088741 [Trifolium repens]
MGGGTLHVSVAKKLFLMKACTIVLNVINMWPMLAKGRLNWSFCAKNIDLQVQRPTSRERKVIPGDYSFSVSYHQRIESWLLRLLSNYEFGDIKMDMGVVERWDFGSKQQKRVLQPVMLAERAGYSLQRVMHLSTCYCM